MSNAVAIRESVLPTQENWNQILAMGNAAFKSGLLPKSIQTPEAAAIIMLRGYELGLPPMVALDSLYVVNNKIGISADMLLAGIREAHPKAEIIIKKSDSKECVIMARRPEQKDLTEFKYTIEEAKEAQLLVKDNWRKHPADMLFARCVTRMKRRLFPEVMKGLSHTPEELEEVRDVTPSADQAKHSGETKIKSIKNFAPQTREEAENWEPSKSNSSQCEQIQEPDAGKDSELTIDERTEITKRIAGIAIQAGYNKETYQARVKELIGDKKFPTLTRSELSDLEAVFKAEAARRETVSEPETKEA